MSNDRRRIDQIPRAGGVSLTDQVPIWQGGRTRIATIQGLIQGPVSDLVEGITGLNPSDPMGLLALKRAQNLADLSNVATARTNLGLGTSARLDAGIAGGVALYNDPRFDAIGGGGSVTSAQILDSTVSGRAILTGTPAASRVALGLGTAATLAVGVSGGVAAYDDPRFSNTGGGGAPSTVTASQISDSSTSGRQVVTGSPAQARAAIELTGAIKLGPNTATAPAWNTFATHVEAVSVNVGGLPDVCFPGGNTVGCYNAILGAVDIKTGGQNNLSTFAAGVGGIVRSNMSNPSPCGVFGAAMANTPDGEFAQVFPANFVVTNQRDLNPNSTTGVKRAEMYGVEIDMEVHPADDGTAPLINARGTWATGNSRIQPTGEFTAHLVGPAGILRTPIVPWKKAFRSQLGAAQIAFEAGELTVSGACSSQPIIMIGRNGSGQSLTNSLLTDQDGNMLARVSGAAMVVQTSGGSTGITLRTDGRLQAINVDVTSSIGIGGNASVNGTLTAGTANVGSFNASSNAGIGGNLTVNGGLAANTVGAGTFYLGGQTVQLTASGGTIPPGFKGLIVAG